MRFIPLLAVAGTLILAASPALAASFLEGSVGTNANAFLTNATSGGDVQHRRIVTGGPTFNLSPSQAVSQASATVGGATSTVRSTSSATAAWTSLNAGTFQSTTTRDMTLPKTSNQGLFAGANTFDHAAPGNPAFDFMFKASGTDNHIGIDYSVLLTGDKGAVSPGMGSWQIVLQEILDGGAKKDVGFLQINGAADHKLFNAALETGHTYDLRFLNMEDIVLPDTAFHNISSRDVATFNWTIDDKGVVGGVPEPASWALMLGGFGMIGSTLRSAKRRATVAL